MIEHFNEIIISSGGNKGIALIGALNEFFNRYPIKKIKYYSGCSVGSIICLLLNIGYNINELNEILFKINFGNFQELKVRNLLEKCGFDEGIKFTNFFKALLLNKNFNQNITFSELYRLTDKILTITVVNITKGITEYHNYINTPDLSVVLSVRMSINIPILFSPIFYSNCYYVDGALLDPFPFFYNKNTIKIGFWLFEKYELNFIRNSEVTFVDQLLSSFSYTTELLKIVYINYIKNKYKKIPKNVIYIDFDFVTENIHLFEVNHTERLKMFNIGRKKCIIFFKRKNNTFLKKKYFRRWKKILLEKR
jgi:hypothetical protein